MDYKEFLPNVRRVLKSDNSVVSSFDETADAEKSVGAVKEYAGLVAGALNADLVAAMDVNGFKDFALQVAGTFVGTLTLQASNDNVNWVSLAAYSIAGGALVNTLTAPGIVAGSICTKYMRVRMTAYTSGTATGVLKMSTSAMDIGALMGTITNITTLATLSGSAVPHDGVDSGYPHKIGVKARNADPVVTSNLDRADSYGDLLGKLVTVALAVRALIVKNYITLTTTTETTLLTAGGAGNFLDISSMILTNTSATDVRVDFRDTTAGTVMFSVIAKAGVSAVLDFSDLPICQTTANTNWTAQLAAAVTDVRILAVSAKRAA